MKRTLFLALAFAAPYLGYAQCTSWEAYPDGAQAAKEKHVIYSDLLRMKKYQEAFPHWEALFKHVTAPAESKSKHFKDGIAMYGEFLRAEQDRQKQADYAKKISDLYERNLACNGEQLIDRAYQAYYLFYYANDPAQTMKVLERTVELGKNETPAMVLAPYAWMAVESFKAKNPNYNAERMRSLYQFFKDVLAHQTGKKAKDLAAYEQAWKEIQGYFAEIETAIFDCDYFVNKWKPFFDKDPNNQPQNAQIIEELKQKAKCPDTNELLVEIEASYAPYKAMLDSIRQDSLFKCCMSNVQRASYLDKKGEKAKAYEYYIKALDDTDVKNEEKAKIAYRIAYHYYAEERNFPVARTYARKASAFNPNWSEPYTLVGLMYASSGKLCGPGTGWDSQVVVWAAMDEWQKACSVDPDNCQDARKYLGQYSAYLPTESEGFQRGYKNGQAYSIGCWIGVTTTIRLK
jgi:hypothetical protein